MGEPLVCGALWMEEVQLVDAQGMPVCVKRKGALPEGECDDVIVTTDEFVL